MRQEVVILHVGLAFVAALLAGCGGGGGASGGGGDPTPAPTPPVATTTTTTEPEYGAQIKVVNYNLFWWCVSGNPQHNPENHNENCGRYTGGRGFQQLYGVIKGVGPFDIIGFSECLDSQQIMTGIGMADTFEAYLAPPQSGNVHDSGFAWSKEKFDKLEGPDADLMSNDMYGNRWLGWVRLKVKATGQTLFYGNTHGGLGVCGAQGGRNVYNNFMKSIAAHRKPEDSLIITGDFNCLPSQEVMQLLMQNFTTFHDETMKYDNIMRSNWVRADDTYTKNAPPSDHSIIWNKLSLPQWTPGHVVPDPPPAPGPGPPTPSPAGPVVPSLCKNLKCGNHDATCWCSEVCEKYNDCCADFKDVCSPGAIKSNSSITEMV